MRESKITAPNRCNKSNNTFIKHVN